MKRETRRPGKADAPAAPASADDSFDARLDAAIERANAHAPFLRGLIRNQPDLVARIRATGFDASLEQALALPDVADAERSLRLARNAVALIVALADLAGCWPLERVTAALSRFADLALDCAIGAAFRERGFEAQGLVALALGKLGSNELNYSSDIDLIFLHDEDRMPRRPRDDPTEAAVRIVRRIVALLAATTGDGYVFRVDLRLRPDPDSTPSSLPYGAAVSYYQSQALAWERAAFIRARPAAGDTALGARFLKEIEPFIWRRSLDFSALAEIRDVSQRIREHFDQSGVIGPGFDLKRGRGGIREIEFFAQVQQMIFGGRNPELRAPTTMDALRALAAAGKIADDDERLLEGAYRLFRTTEHRLQMQADQQTHSIPENAAERGHLAALAGEKDWKTLEGKLRGPLGRVGQLYDRLLESGEQQGAHIPRPAARIRLWAEEKHIDDAELCADLLGRWRLGQPRSLRAAEAQSAFEAVIPLLLEQLGRGPAGRKALLRLDRMIRALPSGVQFWRLLAANPALADVVGRVLSATPFLADALSARPSLLDILLQPAPPLDGAEAALSELKSAVGRLEGEALLDRVRLWTSERRFQLGVQLVDAAIAPGAAARQMADMAEAAVTLLAERVTDEFRARNGAVPGGRLVPLALGRFGGGELTLQSDLDLVFLFTGSFETLSTGTPPQTASAWFNRLVPRILAALTAPTAAGSLYQVDTRLRPSGNDGLHAVSIDSFERYQQREAGLLEQMALVRARPISCCAEDAADVRARLDRLNARPRDPARIFPEILELRSYMNHHKPPRGPYDIKLMKNGLVDIEFLVTARALTSGQPVSPVLDEAIRMLAPSLGEAARLLMDMLIMLRLVQPHDSASPPDPLSADVLARSLGRRDFHQLKADLAAARRIVDKAWKENFEGYRAS